MGLPDRTIQYLDLRIFDRRLQARREEFLIGRENDLISILNDRVNQLRYITLIILQKIRSRLDPVPENILYMHSPELVSVGPSGFAHTPVMDKSNPECFPAKRVKNPVQNASA